MQDKFNNQFATQKLREIEEVEEQSVTGGGEAYLPRVGAKKDGYGPKESQVHDGYKKVKGFRAGHTKDKGGFQYKDLWNANEGEIGEGVLASDEVNMLVFLRNLEQTNKSLWEKLRGMYEKWKMVQGTDYGYEDIKKAAAGLAEAEESQFEEGDKAKVAKKGSPQDGKIGNVVSVNNNFYTLEFKNGQKVIFHSSDLKVPKSREPKGPQRVLDVSLEEFLNENYSRFKKETATRTNEQQLHSAMKLAEKKIKEANKILEYTSQLRTDLNETKAGKHTQRVMERITIGIAEAYRKMKKLK